MAPPRFPRSGTENVRWMEDVFPTEEIHLASHPRNQGTHYIEGEVYEYVSDDEDDGFEALEEQPKYRTVEEYREWQIARMVSAIVWTLVVILIVLMLAGGYQLLEWIGDF